MKTKSPRAIRISLNDEVRSSLKKAKKLYPSLSDPEILKVGLSKMIVEDKGLNLEREREEIRRTAAYSMGYDYLNDPEEDAYAKELLKKARTR